jgi:hypothetical protein
VDLPLGRARVYRPRSARTAPQLLEERASAWKNEKEKEKEKEK